MFACPYSLIDLVTWSIQIRNLTCAYLYFQTCISEEIRRTFSGRNSGRAPDSVLAGPASGTGTERRGE